MVIKQLREDVIRQGEGRGALRDHVAHGLVGPRGCRVCRAGEIRLVHCAIGESDPAHVVPARRGQVSSF